MEQLIDIAFGIFLGWVIARVCIFFVMQYYNKQLTELDKQLTELKSHIILMEIEVVNDVYYAYNKDTKSFVCQGTNFKEIRDNFAIRYPDFDGVVVSGPKDVLASFKEQMKEIKNESSNSVGPTP